MATITLIENVRSSQELQSTLAHMGISGTVQGTVNGNEELQNYLEHFGVKGMHWGSRKASYNDPPSGGGGSRMVRSGAPVAKGPTGGAKYLAKNGGSQKKAIAKTVGKAAATEFLLQGLGKNLVNANLRNHPAARAGAHVAINVLGVANAAYNARKIVQIHKAANKAKGR